MFSNGSWRPAPLALVLLCLSGIHTHAYAQNEPINLAWDANPQPAVAGYIVYVGNTSGSYTEQYDVGNQTSFEYTRVTGGRPYFFAVAAYTPGLEVGPRSEEIFFLGGNVTAGTPATISAARTSQSAGTSSTSGPALCTFAGQSDCYRVDRVASLPWEISVLTPTGDGRLLFIDDGGRHVRLIAGDTLMPDAALTADGTSRLTGIVVDPAFDRNHFVYVSEIDRRADGRRDLSIVRYREVAGLLAEGAALVSAIPLPSYGDAPFTVDGSRRLYVAVPGSSSAESPYAGTVLRFESDGTVPRDSRAGSPILAHGYAEPTSLVWSSVGNQLWLAGDDGAWEGRLARLALSGDAAEWPRMPAGVALDRDAMILSLFSAGPSTSGSTTARVETGGVALIDDEGVLLRIDPYTQRVAAASLPSIAVLGGQPISAVLDGGVIYVVVRPDDTDVTGSHIVRIRQN